MMMTMKKLLLVLCALMWTVGTAFAAINANTASVDELQTVSGIGPTIAQRIVDERRKGPYKNLDDLQARVRGVGEASIRKMSAAGLRVSGGSSRAADAKGDAKARSKSEAKAVDPKPDMKADASRADKSARAESPKLAPAKDAAPK